MAEANRKQDRMAMMAELPVHEVLIKMSLPMMISFFIQAMYNIVDSMFVARISENALTAVSLAFPMQQIVTAIAVGTSTGVSAVWSRYMGKGEKDKASAAIRTMTAMSLIFTALFIALGLFASGPLYRAQTDVEEIAEMGATYLMINWVFSCGSIFSKYFERLLVSSGRATLSMATMLCGAIFNLIFDPLLIFGIGPFPKLGIAGAALATVGGQIFSALIAIALNMKHNEAVRHDMLRPAFDLRAAEDILRVGLPSIITMGLSSVTSFSINQILLTYSTTATAVYGVWMKLQNFCYMPSFGLNNGMVPILSYNYGTGRVDRVKQTMKISMTGKADLVHDKIDATVGISPLGTVDKLINNIPIAGWVLGGKEQSLLLALFKVDGPVSDPDADMVPVRSVSSKAVGIFRRLLHLPVKIFKSPGEVLNNQ